MVRYAKGQTCGVVLSLDASGSLGQFHSDEIPLKPAILFLIAASAFAQTAIVPGGGGQLAQAVGASDTTIYVVNSSCALNGYSTACTSAFSAGQTYAFDNEVFLIGTITPGTLTTALTVTRGVNSVAAAHGAVPILSYQLSSIVSVANYVAPTAGGLSLSAQCSAAVSAKLSLSIGVTAPVPATSTCSASIQFMQGGIIQPASGQNLSLSGSIQGNLPRQIFDLSAGGTIAFTPTFRSTGMYPENWGAAGDGSTDDAAKVQACVSSISAGSSCELVANNGYGVCSTTIMDRAGLLHGAGVVGRLVPCQTFPANSPVLKLTPNQFTGTVNTSGTAVTWVSGDHFGTLWGTAGFPSYMVVNGVNYTISSCASSTACTLSSTAGTQSGSAFGVGSGTKNIYNQATGFVIDNLYMNGWNGSARAPSSGLMIEATDQMTMSNFNCYSMTGYCLSFGSNAGPVRESNFYNTTIAWAGSSSLAAMQVIDPTGAADNNNELSFYGIQIFSCPYTHLLISKGTNAGAGPRFLNFYGFQFEGGSLNEAGGTVVTAADLVYVPTAGFGINFSGGTAGSNSGYVNGVSSGYALFRFGLNSAAASGNTTYVDGYQITNAYLGDYSAGSNGGTCVVSNGSNTGQLNNIRWAACPGGTFTLGYLPFNTTTITTAFNNFVYASAMDWSGGPPQGALNKIVGDNFFNLSAPQSVTPTSYNVMSNGNQYGGYMQLDTDGTTRRTLMYAGGDGTVHHKAILGGNIVNESAESIGTVNTAGTAVTWVSGDHFNVLWGTTGFPASMSVIGVNYTITSCASTTACTLSSTAGTQTAVAYAVGATAYLTIGPNGFGSSKAIPFASLTACISGAEGLHHAVTDSSTNTWGATITGGGANHVEAYCNGSNWTVVSK
jgi:hypothetical protein